MNYKKIFALSLVGISCLTPIRAKAFDNWLDRGQQPMILASNTVVDPYEKIPYVDGETSLGVQVVDSVPAESLHFEVPLYVTMAVVDLKEEVVMPSGYGITNLSQNQNGNLGDMAVIWVEATPHSTRDYWEFVPEVGDAANEMELSVGGIPIRVESGETIKLDLTDSVLYDKDTKKFTPIKAGETQELELSGRVKSASRSNKKAVAQFSLKYTVSQLDTNGDPVGVYYEGPLPNVESINK